MHYIPGLRICVDAETEIIGIDDTEIGEFAYDYVGVEAELEQFTHFVNATGTAREPEQVHRRPYSKEMAASLSSEPRVSR